jgi:large subunit ribosomal protein L13e
MKHNNQLPNVHFHKDWKRRVKTWFNQPGRKLRRRKARALKAARIAPRPVDGALRPAVHCPTLRYNTKLRVGRGFTLDEIRAAGMTPQYARTIGIAVDHRRKNRSVESLTRNVNRLKAYKARLVVIPRKVKKGAAPIEVPKQLTGPILPIADEYQREAPRAITDAERKVSAYATLRRARAVARYAGMAEKRARLAAEAEANKAGAKK